MPDTGDDSERRLRRSHLVVSLGAVSVAASVTALTCLAALVVVATIDKASALSTVALTLAILAFVVQILVFIVQSASASQQMAQAQELHGRMQYLLGTIGEQTANTQAVVSKIDDHLLEAALGKALREAEISGSERGDRVDVRSVAADAARSVREAAETPGNPAEESEARWPPPPPPDVRRKRLEELSSFPADTQQLHKALASLTDIETGSGLPGTYGAMVKVLGRDERDSLSAPFVGPGLTYNSAMDALIRVGLAERLQPPLRHIVRLTDDGRLVARVLLSDDDPPPGLVESVKRLKRMADAFEEDMTGFAERLTEMQMSEGTDGGADGVDHDIADGTEADTPPNEVVGASPGGSAEGRKDGSDGEPPVEA